MYYGVNCNIYLPSRNYPFRVTTFNEQKTGTRYFLSIKKAVAYALEKESLTAKPQDFIKLTALSVQSEEQETLSLEG